MRSRLEWLEKQLDREDLSDEMVDLYNREANEIQGSLNDKLAAQNQRITDEHKANLHRIVYLVKQGRVKSLIEEYGHQFIGQYSITPNFQVRSYASNSRSPNQANVWQFTSHEECQKKLTKLLYDRIYTHYLRDSSYTEFIAQIIDVEFFSGEKAS